MKKTILAALALLTLASCAKESSTTELIDPTAPVAATFTSAAITRVADNAWVAEDKIGITMVATADNTLATGSYENVPYTVGAAGESGTFSADDKIIYFPVDGSEVVDFIAYYPHSTIDSDSNIEISVEDQEYEHIDLVAAKAVGKSKSSSTVVFADNTTSGGSNEAFSHQLSKLTMTIIAGDGVGSLDGLVTTIKGHKTTAEFNIYTFAISGEDNVKDMVTATTKYGLDGSDYSVAYTSAILLPTEKVSGSTIEFKTTDGNVYILDISEIAFAKGEENKYEITLNRTGATISGATISNWGSGEVVDNGELDASDYVEREETISAKLVYEEGDYSIYVQLDMSNFDFFASRTLYIYQTSSPDVVYTETIINNSTNNCSPTISPLVMESEYTIYLYTEYTDGTASTSNVVTVSTEASTATS